MSLHTSKIDRDEYIPDSAAEEDVVEVVPAVLLPMPLRTFLIFMVMFFRVHSQL